MGFGGRGGTRAGHPGLSGNGSDWRGIRDRATVPDDTTGSAITRSGVVQGFANWVRPRHQPGPPAKGPRWHGAGRGGGEPMPAAGRRPLDVFRPHGGADPLIVDEHLGCCAASARFIIRMSVWTRGPQGSRAPGAALPRQQGKAVLYALGLLVLHLAPEPATKPPGAGAGALRWAWDLLIASRFESNGGYGGLPESAECPQWRTV